jgi:regulator of sirC expression with transglutaminase-like and TPR domain
MTLITHPAEARRQFRDFAAEELTGDDLARGALLIALEDYPQLDVEEQLSQLDDLAARAARRGAAGDPPVFRLGHLVSEMFDADGYHGDETDYYDPRNAYLNEVLERRSGLPIALSIIFVHAARRMGLSAAGVGLPGHFIVKVQFELNEVYVDPYQGGVMLTMEEIAVLISGGSGGRARLTSDHLRAWSARETLARVLGNLQNMWTRAGDLRKAASARERITILDTLRPQSQ